MSTLTQSPVSPQPLTSSLLAASGSDTPKKVKRKKASRACFHCQKAHLTCDDARPCSRCLKRGLESTCQDGVRKKAKYLRDVDTEVVTPVHPQDVNRVKEEERLSSPVSSRAETPPFPDIPLPEGTINPATVSRQSTDTAQLQDSFPLFGDNVLFDYPPLSQYDFDSKAANLEYSMLSTMLGNVTTPGTDQASPDTFSYSPAIKSFQHNILPQSSMKSDNGHFQTPFLGAPAPTLPNAPTHQSPLSQNGSSATHATSPKVPSIAGYADPHGQRPTPVARRPFTTANGNDPTNIYKSITKPFSYTNGYHLLNAYLRSRFEKNDLLRIARAIVGYRPSFIALTKTLREEDLTFMEICFQRTLLEYEKFVGYSGTPTVIWRRTGQIELVGKEFCLLTQWTREKLLSKQTFIVELMDDSSVVEYFEKFSAHAFGDTSSVQTTCVLLTPQKKPVPCAFCFTIKRDVFDIPMMIAGNFLPVL